MIILYIKDQPNTEDCRFLQAIRDIHSLSESADKAYMGDNPEPVINDLAKVGWFAIPEQWIPAQEFDKNNAPIERTVGELNLHYNWPEEFIPLPGTGIPEKIEHIENFLTKMFPTRGI